MKRRAIVLMLLAGCMAATAAFAADSSPEAKRFAGKWKAVSLEHDGDQVGAEQAQVVVLKFEGNDLSFQAGEGEQKATFKLDPEKKPHEIDVTHKNQNGADETLRGIYRFDEKKLILCIPAPGFADTARPTEFKTQAGSNLVLLTLEHADS